jgi:3',5'-cyclic AMP phosphodiesterase CpdA
MLTVLQVSDLRFGALHRFGAEGLTEADRRHDRLAARLLDDLAGLRGSDGLVPDLVVVAGDLAEAAKPVEYEAAHAFLCALRDGLGLPTERIVVVPGNHDVNRKKCRAYFLDREADGEQPVAPYWPKWEAYAALHSRLREAEFPKDQPWSCVELPELGVAVAALNSTMADSHRDSDHYGWLGEDQLRYFADRLTGAGARGWLRVGVGHHAPVPAVHHTPVPDAGLHEEAGLRDADLFGELLAPHLDLLLHGHAGHGRVQHFGAAALPVFGTGNAGIRAGEAASQYQLVQVHQYGIRVYARQYHPSQRRWVGDTSVSERGDTFWRDIPGLGRAARTSPGSGCRTAAGSGTCPIAMRTCFVTRTRTACWSGWPRCAGCASPPPWSPRSTGTCGWPSTRR